MKKFIFAPILSASLVLISCANSVKKEDVTSAKNGDFKSVESKVFTGEEILIDASHRTELSLDRIVNKTEFFKLETTANNIIGSVSQLFFTDSLIIVVDESDAMAINVFDLKGKFKYHVGQRGKGPGEFVEISNVSIEPLNNQIAVLDRMQKKEIYYAMNGQYDRSVKSPFMLSYFEYLQSGSKAYYRFGMRDPRLGDFKDKPLIVTDSQNKVLYGDCTDNYKPNRFEMAMNRPLRKFDNEVFFSPNFSNKIYLVTDSMLIPKYSINIASYGMPPNDGQMTNELFREYRSRCYFFNGEIIELKDLTYINIMTPTGDPFVVYSHAKKRTFFSTDKGKNPLFPFINNQVPVARYQDNAVVFSVSAFQLMMNKKDLYKQYPDKKYLDGLYEGLTENSNPVLVVCHLNKNL